MKGMIFAAGLGTRLRPLTDSCPKSLIEVGGKPMLLRTVERMLDAGIREIAVNIHHHAEMMRGYIASLELEGIRFHISDESALLLDTGGGLLNVRSWIGHEDVVVHNADVFTDVSLSKMISVHEDTGADVTLLVRPAASSRALLWNSGDRLCGWTDLSSGSVRPAGLDVSDLTPRGFGGVHVLGTKALDALAAYTAEPVFSITPFYADCCSRLDIRAFPLDGAVWVDIGRPDTLAAARALAAT